MNDEDVWERQLKVDLLKSQMLRECLLTLRILRGVGVKVNDEEVWETHLKAALLLVREFRCKAVVQMLDPRAVRVALKYALMIDDYIAKEEKGLTQAEEQQLEKLAQELFFKTPQIKEKLKHDDKET